VITTAPALTQQPSPPGPPPTRIPAPAASVHAKSGERTFLRAGHKQGQKRFQDCDFLTRTKAATNPGLNSGAWLGSCASQVLSGVGTSTSACPSARSDAHGNSDPTSAGNEPLYCGSQNLAGAHPSASADSISPARSPSVIVVPSSSHPSAHTRNHRQPASQPVGQLLLVYCHAHSEEF
jgi:hypothetical protein